MESTLEAIGNTLISPGDTVVEYTGGTTGPALALVRLMRALGGD